MDGTFDSAKIVAALPANQTSTVSQYKGATVIAFPAASVAFIGDSIALAGDATSVMGALDRQTSAVSIDEALLVQVGQLSATDDVWFVSTVSPGLLMPGNLPQQAQQASAFLANIMGFSGGAKFGADIPVTLDVIANNPQNAEALGNLLKLALSMLGNNPNVQTLMQTLQVSTAGSTLNVALTIPEAQVEAMISAGKAASNRQKRQ
jgi:hypothetical protein